jgi:glycosyltransferase involved in cell wall biosynthesis
MTRRRRFRLLVVSHSCVVPSNQDFYGRIGRLADCEVDIVLPERWRNDYGEHVARHSPRFSGRLHPLPVLGRGRVPLHLYRARLRRILREVEPDAAYIHNEPYALASMQWALALGSRVPFGFYAAQNLLKRYPLPVRIGERLVHRRASFAFPVSEEVGRILRQRGYGGPLEVLPLPFDPARLDGGADHSQVPPVIGYLGRLSSEKGVDILLEACAKVRHLDYRCVIAGDGPARAELRDLAGRLGLEQRVDWMGYVNHAEVAKLYSNLHVVVVPSRTTPSWKEQFGRVVVESLAAEVPVLVSDSGELPRLVGRTGGGWVFPENDADALADRLRDVLGRPDLRTMAGRSGATYVRTYLTLDAVASRFADVVLASTG